MIKVLIIRDHAVTKYPGHDTLIGINEKGEVVQITGRKCEDIAVEVVEDGGSLLS